MSFNNIQFDKENVLRAFLWANTVETVELMNTIGNLAQDEEHGQITVLLKLMKPYHRKHILDQWEADKDFWDHSLQALDLALDRARYDPSVLFTEASQTWTCFICGVGLEDVRGAAFRLKPCGACVSHDSCWEGVRRKVEKQKKQKLNPMYPLIGPCHCAYIGRGPEKDWDFLLQKSTDRKQAYAGLYEEAIKGLESRKRRQNDMAEDPQEADDASDTEEEPAPKKRRASGDSNGEVAAEDDMMDDDTEEEPKVHKTASEKRKANEGGIGLTAKKAKTNHNNAVDSDGLNADNESTGKVTEEARLTHDARNAGERMRTAAPDAGTGSTRNLSETDNDVAADVGEKRKIHVGTAEDGQALKKLRLDDQIPGSQPASEA